VISAWAFSGRDRGAEIAETIFDRMETSEIRLDTTTFNTLSSAWGRQKDPEERATDILHTCLQSRNQVSSMLGQHPRVLPLSLMLGRKQSTPPQGFQGKGAVGRDEREVCRK